MRIVIEGDGKPEQIQSFGCCAYSTKAQPMKQYYGVRHAAIHSHVRRRVLTRLAKNAPKLSESAAEA